MFILHKYSSFANFPALFKEIPEEFGYFTDIFQFVAATFM